MNGLVQAIGPFYLLIARFLFVLFALLIFISIKRHMLNRSKSTQVLAVLDVENGTTRLPITHHETTIGRSKSCDVVIPLMTISRQHAVLSMVEQNQWRIADTKSKGGIYVNGIPMDQNTVINIGDVIMLGGMKLVLKSASAFDQAMETQKKSKTAWVHRKKESRTASLRKPGSISIAFFFLNLFQVLACAQFLIVSDRKYAVPLLITFGFLFLVPWVYKIIARSLGNHNIGAEAAAFFLTTLGICATASAAPYGLIKQLAAVILGLVIFCTLCAVLKNLKLVMKLRPYAGILSLLLLGANLLLGVTINGQKNWIDLGFMTVQPSEFVKILFIFAGAATLEWLLTAKNLALLTTYAVGCIGLLFLMGDFGTALIFFFTFIILIFMTSGDIRAIILTVISAALGGLLILNFKPYIITRFSAWGNVWQHVNDSGFQQTRTLIAMVSGGLLGLGGGKGFLKRIFAADTDLVFGILCEEWGLIIALLAAGCYILLLVGVVRSHHTTRSSYYVIAACSAAALFLFQASLNIFGSTDILPLTGVTLPFISNGGSSMAASWGLLSFITAALNDKRPKVPQPTATLSNQRR